MTFEEWWVADPHSGSLEDIAARAWQAATARCAERLRGAADQRRVARVLQQVKSAPGGSDHE